MSVNEAENDQAGDEAETGETAGHLSTMPARRRGAMGEAVADDLAGKVYI